MAVRNRLVATCETVSCDRQASTTTRAMIGPKKKTEPNSVVT